MKYDVNYFISKFEAIPDERWTTGTTDNGSGQHCAMGHLDARASTDVSEPCELQALSDLVGTASIVMAINDGHTGYKQETPKARVLAALRDIKRKQEGEKA